MTGRGGASPTPFGREVLCTPSDSDSDSDFDLDLAVGVSRSGSTLLLPLPTSVLTASPYHSGQSLNMITTPRRRPSVTPCRTAVRREPLRSSSSPLEGRPRPCRKAPRGKQASTPTRLSRVFLQGPASSVRRR